MPWERARENATRKMLYASISGNLTTYVLEERDLNLQASNNVFIEIYFHAINKYVISYQIFFKKSSLKSNSGPTEPRSASAYGPSLNVIIIFITYYFNLPETLKIKMLIYITKCHFALL